MRINQMKTTKQGWEKANNIRKIIKHPRCPHCGQKTIQKIQTYTDIHQISRYYICSLCNGTFKKREIYQENFSKRFANNSDILQTV